MRYLTAGESHGKGLTAILDGFPAGVKIDVGEIDRELSRRMCGYGRGERMKIEHDRVDITAGLLGSVTLGSPISFFIKNKDYENHSEAHPINGKGGEPLTAVRPGHADYAGCVKYGFNDARYVLERASARETAARVGVGAFCKQLLSALGVTLGSHVTMIGGVESDCRHESADGLNETADCDPVRCCSPQASIKMREVIDECVKSGDTVGGTAEIIISGLPIGVGSYAQYDRKLDALLSYHLMSVQSAKCVEIGLGKAAASELGSKVHDRIYPSPQGGVMRNTNNAGGIEGGISNGENIIARVSFKPIPTLLRGLNTVDIKSGKAATAAYERSDCCVVPAAAVVAESVAAFVICDELLKVTGGDDFETILARVNEMRARSRR